jgi:heptosyltransferase-2/heptosyltransferase-3
VLATTLIRLVAARYGCAVDVVGAGAWTRPLLENEPSLGRLHVLSSRKAPYLLCPSQWQLVKWLRSRGRGPVYVGDSVSAVFDLLRKGGVHPDDIVSLAPESLPRFETLPWPDRWLALGSLNPRQAYATIEVESQQFRLPRVTLANTDRVAAANWLESKGLDGPLVLFQPGNKRTHKRGKLGSASSSKFWAPENWATVARAILQGMPDSRILLCGSPPEFRMLEDITEAAGHDPRVCNGARDLPIPRLLALIERAHSMISVDTGPAHVAAALGCPLLVMFGNASSLQWRPVGAGAVVVLQGRNAQVSTIPAQEVIDGWRSLALDVQRQ